MVPSPVTCYHGLAPHEGASYAREADDHSSGTSNAVNALAAFDDLVMRRHETDLAGLLRAIDARDPTVLSAIARAPKWGTLRATSSLRALSPRDAPPHRRMRW